VTALMLLKVLGGLYLLWLAYQSLRSATRSDAAPRPPLAGRRWFWRGLLLNLSNPKAVVAWIAALSVGLHADDSPVVLASATLTCMGLGVLNYTGYALLFSLSGMMSAYARARRWIDGAVAALFAAAGLGLLRSAFTR
ncbi:MAG: LysE family transporter, partial [Pseudomonadota bacterium]